jgi:subtilisin
VDAELSPTANINGSGQRVNVDVAVLDTGIELDHPDLNVYTAGARNCSTGRSADDGNGHGTHAAGAIGALDNSEGVVGVAPGARVWPDGVLNNSGSGSWSQIICGIDHVTAHASEVEVASMSLGGSSSDSARHVGGHPHVSGAAALYKATHPSASPSAVKSALQAAGSANWNTATDPTPLTNYC